MWSSESRSSSSSCRRRAGSSWSNLVAPRLVHGQLHHPPHTLRQASSPCWNWRAVLVLPLAPASPRLGGRRRTGSRAPQLSTAQARALVERVLLYALLVALLLLSPLALAAEAAAPAASADLGLREVHLRVLLLELAKHLRDDDDEVGRGTRSAKGGTSGKRTTVEQDQARRVRERDVPRPCAARPTTACPFAAARGESVIGVSCAKPSTRATCS